MGVGETEHDQKERGGQGALLQTGRSWRECGRQGGFPERGAGDTGVTAKHCGGWGLRILGRQGNNQAPRLHGPGGGDSCGLGPLTDGAQAAAPGRLDGGPAGIRGARGAACARGPVRSRLSRVGPGAGRREGRGGGAGPGAPPPQSGSPASGAPWWGVAGRLFETGESEASNTGFRIPSTWDTGPLTSQSLSLLLTWEC